MDYEKKYKEALERAKELYEKRNNSCFVQDQIKGEAALKIFPEIKENKDILKILIHIFQTQYRDSTYSAFPYEGLTTGEEILAWLEKQSEQKPVNNLKWDELTWKDINTLEEIINKVHYEFRNGIGAEGFGKEVLERFREIKGDEYMDSCEQRTTDKIKPKFKVGDWITFYGGKPYKILKIEEEQNGILDYLLLAQNGHNSYYNKKYCDENARLWTIEDAEDGDVLCQDSIPFIFKCWTNNCIAYCGITDFGLFKVVEDDFSWCNGINVTPATKEQRDILFSRMKEAGYEWDVTKKELIKK